MATSDPRTQATERQHRPSGAPLPDDVVAMLRLALDGLPGNQRSAIRLATVDRLPVPEIATRLGTTTAEVMDAMRDGLTTLQDILAVVDPDAVTEGPSGADGAGI